MEQKVRRKRKRMMMIDKWRQEKKKKKIPVLAAVGKKRCTMNTDCSLLPSVTAAKNRMTVPVESNAADSEVVENYTKYRKMERNKKKTEIGVAVAAVETCRNHSDCFHMYFHWMIATLGFALDPVPALVPGLVRTA